MDLHTGYITYEPKNQHWILIPRPGWYEMFLRDSIRVPASIFNAKYIFIKCFQKLIVGIIHFLNFYKIYLSNAKKIFIKYCQIFFVGLTYFLSVYIFNDIHRYLILK